MKNKIIKILFVGVLFLVMLGTANAASRQDKSTKTPLDIQGKTFYAGVEVELNYKQDDHHTAFIGDININYDSNKNLITASVKRSQLNAVFGETDTSMYFNIELNIDYHDFTEDEFILRGNEDKTKYWYDADGSRTYPSSGGNYMEFLSTAEEIWGGNYIATNVGDIALYKGDYYLDPNHPLDGDRSLSEFADCAREVYLDKLNWNFTIEEDVKADFKNIKEVVRSNGTEESRGITPPENMKIEDLYTVYDNMNREVAYVQMYDEEGNPIVLDDDLEVLVDSSENAKILTEWFEISDLEEIQILSFNYSKFFSGVANIKVYVGDKFNTGDVLTLYYYNPNDNNMEKIEETVYVDDDKYVSFQLHHFSDYVLVKSDNKLKNNDGINKKNTDKPSKLKTYLIFGGAGLFFVLVGIITFIIVKKKKTKRG